jgi:hypothetical protein
LASGLDTPEPAEKGITAILSRSCEKAVIGKIKIRIEIIIFFMVFSFF